MDRQHVMVSIWKTLRLFNSFLSPTESSEQLTGKVEVETSIELVWYTRTEGKQQGEGKEEVEQI